MKSPDSEEMYMYTEPNPAYGKSLVREQKVNDYEQYAIPNSQPQEPVYEN